MIYTSGAQAPWKKDGEETLSALTFLQTRGRDVEHARKSADQGLCFGDGGLKREGKAGGREERRGEEEDRRAEIKITNQEIKSAGWHGGVRVWESGMAVWGVTCVCACGGAWMN